MNCNSSSCQSYNLDSSNYHFHFLRIQSDQVHLMSYSRMDMRRTVELKRLLTCLPQGSLGLWKMSGRKGLQPLVFDFLFAFSGSDLGYSSAAEDYPL